MKLDPRPEGANGAKLNLKLFHCWPKENEPVGATLVVARKQGRKKTFLVGCCLEQFAHCFYIAFYKTFYFLPDLFQLKQHCSFSLLAQRKRTKRKGLFGPHKRSFLPAAKPLFQAENPSKASRFFAA
ncbi:MAG: hypothetical protein CFE24_09285 [Flavobacterium sp. BFFFF2]|nr:MAG: hypothetical protein CFE24_09285 [Flavobacterium sp. BFFFF2]